MSTSDQSNTDILRDHILWTIESSDRPFERISVISWPGMERSFIGIELEPEMHAAAEARIIGVDASLRDQLQSQLRAAVESDGRSVETIGLEAWPDLERHTAGARLRYALTNGWTKPEVLDDVARAMGLRITISIDRR